MIASGVHGDDHGAGAEVHGPQVVPHRIGALTTGVRVALAELSVIVRAEALPSWRKRESHCSLLLYMQR